MAGNCGTERAAKKGSDPFWVERAKRQVRLTFYRLVFRGFYYPPGKGPLPLPPKSGWQIVLNGRPRHGNIDGHDFVLQDYTFRATILSDTASPTASEPLLATTGGTWSEPFLLPVDPDLLLERTGYACMDEFEFPPFSVFELILAEMEKEPLAESNFRNSPTLRLRLASLCVRATRNFVTPDCDLRHMPMFA